MEVLLQQLPCITGRFDRPSTYLVLDGRWECLSHWRCVDGTLYAFSSTPRGDRLYGTPYLGPWGLLQAGDADSPRSDMRIEGGKLQSDRAIIDLNDCRVEPGGGIRVPAGTYRPYRRMVLRVGAIRMAVTPDDGPPQQDPPRDAPVLFMKITPDEPCLLGLGDKPQIVFEQPLETDHITVGQEVRISAKVHDPARNLLVVGLDDTQRTETVHREKGKSYKRYISLDPRIVITDSGGNMSAQGTMPFG